MRAASPAKYSLVAGGALSREPDVVGSVEWWLWWRECCGKPNPYRLGSPERSLWKQRVETNPFAVDSLAWHRWREGCREAPVAAGWPCKACCWLVGLSGLIFLIVYLLLHRSSQLPPPTRRPQRS